MEIRQNAKGRKQNEGEYSKSQQKSAKVSKVTLLSMSNPCPYPIQFIESEADKPPARNRWV